MAAFAGSADAVWLDAMCDHCERGRRQNAHWPSQFLCPDRMHAHAPFNAMIRNGWRRQNLLGSHHFNPESSKLTEAGELKVRWIMTQAPQPYRRIFIERSLDPEITKARVATAQLFASDAANKIAGGETPQVQETHIVSEGHPASTVDFVNNQYRENMRVPVLPTSSSDQEGQ